MRGVSAMVLGEHHEALSTVPSAPHKEFPARNMSSITGRDALLNWLWAGKMGPGEGSAALAVRTTASRANVPGMSFTIVIVG